MGEMRDNGRDNGSSRERHQGSARPSSRADQRVVFKESREYKREKTGRERKGKRKRKNARKTKKDQERQRKTKRKMNGIGNVNECSAPPGEYGRHLAQRSEYLALRTLLRGDIECGAPP